MRIPAWFRVVFVAVMLSLCCVTCWYVMETTSLYACNQDLRLQLSTSKQREVKQQTEYQAVCDALPVAQAALAEAQPLADAAKQTENLLRAERKQLRSDIAELKSTLSQLEAVNATMRDIVNGIHDVTNKLFQTETIID